MKKSVASLYQAVDLCQDIPPLLIGERCNPNGSKAFREALLAEDWDACLKVALDQEARGAQVLDISVAYVGRDEQSDMMKMISLFAGSCMAPLMIDSTNPDTIEAALPLYPGRAIINSINLEDGGENLERICRMAKKYGAAVVALTITEEGMALTCDEKVAAARRIHDLAVNSYGLRPQDLIFDLLTFTVGSGDEKMRMAAIETLNAIRQVKQELPGVGFTLGVSNISFGLRPAARKVLNSVFLHDAVEAGLDTAIVDVAKILPLTSISQEDREICSDLLYNRGAEPLMSFIEHFEQAVDVDDADDETRVLPEEVLRHKVLKGDKEGLDDLLTELRGRWRPLDIINTLLVPAMREVGELFGRGELLLPFVLQSAETMKQAVALLEPFMEKVAGEEQTSILLATVAGDVHDIGKNLVDIILSNNGYKVYNIGIKVPAEEIIARAKELKPDVIALSGLLVKSALLMKEDLAQFQAAGLTQPVLLGGAALTARFVADECVPRYQSPVVYCADAFDALKAVREFEAGKLEATSVEVKESTSGAGSGRMLEVEHMLDVPSAPFLGSRIETLTDIEALFPLLNEQALFRGRWGYKCGKLSAPEYAELVAKEVMPAYARIKREALAEGLLQPQIAYGYYRCRSEGDELVLEDSAREYRFGFPRQNFAPNLCVSDFFRTDEEGSDLAGLFVVTLGSKLAEKTKALYEADAYKEYLLWHGFGVELTDALAEYWHMRMRRELGIDQSESRNLAGNIVRQFPGTRYGFGYPACPDLELQRPTFELLRPERIGVSLTETCEMVPEMTTSALVAHHPQSRYFAV
jgi:5-methyltetrahydrofolate--homocysteine methyltransferase